ncbi:MAG: hypothetical protein RIR17_1365 [Planctomycetota bacterium]
MRVRLPPEPYNLKIMNHEIYLNKELFPLTTYEGLALKDQIMKDATLFDEIQEMKEKGISLGSEQELQLKELEIKIPHATRLIANEWTKNI